MYNTKEKIRYSFKVFIEQFPDLYVNLQRIKYRNSWYKNSIINKDTDIVIEGFPRCANSFAVQAFKLAQQEQKYKIATHMHSPAQIIMAVKYKKPVIVMVRRPEDCIVSLRALMIQYNSSLKSEIISASFNPIIKYYINFYKKLIPYKSDIVISDFGDTISNFGDILTAVNLKYDKKFCIYNNSENEKEYIFKNFGNHLSPDKQRNELKKILKAQYEEANESLKFQANEVYKKIIN
ncbi:MAG: hypothetical protein CMO01_17970 [Thalassobius sp.]|nr:hypothetical protein [Thalassovita sp.]